MSTVFLLYLVCNMYMQKYVANIKLIHYVTIEYKREVYMKFKLVWGLRSNKRDSRTTTTLLRRNVSQQFPPFVTRLPPQTQIPGDSRRSTVAVSLLLFNPTILRFYSLFLFQMNEFKRDDPSTNILFVQTVQKYPCLYNYKLSEYSRRDLTEDAWMNVAQEMNFTGNYNSVTD